MTDSHGSADAPLLRLRGLSKRYGERPPVLENVSFDVHRGEFLYVTGPSGAGKTTLLRLLYRAEVPDRGQVLFCGRDLSRLSHDSTPYLRRNIGIVFQDFRLLPDQSIFANVALALEVLGVRSREVSARVAAVLERVGLAGREREIIRHLSGGEQQRVAVARAVVAGPPLVLADEPTGNLDSMRAAEVVALLEAVHRRGTAIVLATHDQMLMAARPRRTVALARGCAVDFPEEASGRALELAEALARAERHAERPMAGPAPAGDDGDEAEAMAAPLMAVAE